MVLPDPGTARVLRTQPEIARAIAAYPRVTKAVVGIGAWAPGLSTVADAVDEARPRGMLHELGVRGELSGRAVRRRGPRRGHAAHRPR